VLHQNFRLPMYRLLCVTLVIFGLWVTWPGRALAVRVKSAGGTGVDGEVAKTRTDDAGRYRFENLPRGTHKVTLDPTTLPPSLRPAEGEAVPTLWVIPGQEQTSEALASGVRFTVAYNQDSGAITGLVFWDRDDDGLQGPGEMGLAGVSVIDPTIHQYFVPFDDKKDLIELLRASNICQGQQTAQPVSNTVTSGVSLAASTNGTVYYYDHWEDGYDLDPLQPGPTTEVGTLDAGKVRLFSNDIDTRLVGSRLPYYYDGRDRITVVGGDAAVIRYAYPSLVDIPIDPIGSRLAGAWEIEQTANWGTAYVIPAGEDWGVGSDFEFTGASIMALQNNTQIYLNGVLTATRNTGETFFVNGAGDLAGGGGLDSGDTFTATAPIMGHMYSSVCAVNLPGVGGPWAGNGYSLEPTAHWTSDYWSPVTSRISCDGRKMDIFVYNPGLTATLVVDNGTVYTVSLPPGSSSVAALIMPSNFSDSRGVHLYTPGGEPFWGVANFDTLRTFYEWGFSLMPARDLSAQVILGWSPGNSNLPPLAQYPPNGNVAWVTAVTDTVVFIDLNGDGNPDQVDCNGDGDTDDWAVDGVCDEPTSNLGITLTQGQTLRVADPTDADLSGAFIYTQDLNKKIAVTWGEDSCVADYGLPYLDLGYTVLPLGTPYFSKSDALAQDVDQSGDITPGDILTYTIVILNTGMGPMTNVVMTDVLPYTYTDFVAGSIDVTVPPPTGTVTYDDGSGLFTHTLVPTGTFGVDPAVQQLRITWPQINGRQTVTVTLRVQIQQSVPPDIRDILNKAVVSSSETPPTDSSTDTTVGAPILQLTKLVSSNTVRPGGLLTYTVVASNVGTAAALSTVVVDDLPPWMTYISGTLDLTWPVAHVVTTSTPITRAIQDFFGTVGDNFDNSNHTATTGWTGNDGTLSWMGDWSEVGDDGAVTTGDVRVVAASVNANSPTSYLFVTDTDDQDSGLRRCADLSQFVEPHLSYKLRGYLDTPDADDFYRVTVTSTLAPTPVPLIREVFNDDTAYVTRDLVMSAYAGHSQVCITFFGEAGLDSTLADPFLDYYRFDDVFIYEASHARYETVNQIRETTVISYSRVLTDPVSYTRIPSDPNTPAITHTMQVTQPFHFPASSQLTATFQVQVAVPLTNGLTMTNTACVTATNWITPTCDDASVQVVSGHVLSVTKSAQAHVVLAGAPLTYTIAWGLSGNEPAQDVTISDTVPANTTLITASLPVTVNGALLTWPLGTVLPPASGVVTLVVQVNGGLPPGTMLTNAVIITDTSGVTDTSTITTPVTIGADLAIFKSDEPDPVIPGTLLTYTLVAVNLGPTDAVGVVVTDTLPPQVTFVSATPTPSSTTPLTWSLGVLTVGETRRLTVTVQVSVAASQTFTNTAVVGSTTPDDYPPNNRADEPTTPLVPGLVLVKRVTPGEIVRGMPFTYTIQITNTGQITFSPLVLTDTLPPDFYYVVGSGVPSTPTVVAEPLLRWDDLGTFAPGASITVAFAVTATQGITGTYVNTATVAGHYPGGVLTDTDDVPVALHDPRVALAKQLAGYDRDNVAPNYVTFTIAITNVGVSVIDVLPLLDQYDPYYLSFVWAAPMPDRPEDDGLLTWYDLTAPPPSGYNGFGRNLAPGEAFNIITVFSVTHDITTTYNSAAVGDAIDVYQNPTNRPTDTVPITNTIPTAVELLYFRVDGVAGQQVRLAWATAVEIDNYGFNLYRADTNDPARARLIHFEPAALRGSRPGATYVYVDTVPSDGVWWYWLADVDTRGNETRRAQATASVGVNVALPYKVYLPVLMKGP
jgi:uncharacterized repeat protein (TIGR01451 family)